MNFYLMIINAKHYFDQKSSGQVGQEDAAIQSEISELISAISFPICLCA